MSNPNSADKRAADKKAKAAEAAFLADVAEAQAKAAQAENIGTAQKPVDGSANLGAVPSNHNLRAQWADEVKVILDQFKANDRARLTVWVRMGTKLAAIAGKFVVYADNGKPAKGKDGKVIKDNNAYSKWLTEAGLTTGELKNPNTRSAAIWLAANWLDVQAVPAAMKHNHPVHAKQAYQDFKKALDAAKAVYDGEDFDTADFTENYDPKAKASGSTVPHSIDTCLRQIKAALKGGVSILDYNAKGTNDQAALIILLKAELSIAQSEVARLEKDLADARGGADAPDAPKAKGGRKSKAKAKTEFGDEVPEAQDGVWEEVPHENAPLALPAPTLALPAPKDEDEDVLL